MSFSTSMSREASAHIGLNAVDRLYLIYLSVVLVLAIATGQATFTIIVGHLVIGVFIWLAAMYRDRSALVEFLHDWYPLAMFIFSFEEVARFSLLLAPHWRDRHIIAFEQHLFGASPNLFFSRLASRPLSELMDMGYFSFYPLFPVVGGLLYSRKDKRPFRALLIWSVVMYFISFVVYLGFPTEGPRHALTGYHMPPDGWVFSRVVRFIQAGAGVHGNALPSSHVALALLCAMTAQRWLPRVAPFAWASVCLICLGAVYDGYHYASDVMAGILVALTSVRIGGLMVSQSSRIDRPTALTKS
jgi:membrane-associated phospholipid phosphatase